MMASKSKSRTHRKKNSTQLSDLGLFDIPNLDIEENIDEDLSDADESTLENELEALLRGETPMARKKPKPRAPVDIEKIAAECLKDSEDEDDDDDINEEELLKELQTLKPDSIVEEEPISTANETQSDLEKSPHFQESSHESLMNLLQGRHNLYSEAFTAAKLINDNSKSRRYERALKTLESQIKSVKTGATINEEDIPPIVKIPKPPLPSPSISQPSELIDDTDKMESNSDKSMPSSLSREKLVSDSKKESNSSSVCSMLKIRQNEYKSAALEAKKSGNKELALQLMKTAKAFDLVIEAAERNEPVDLTNIPPKPPHMFSEGSIHVTGIHVEKKEQANEQMQTASDLEAAAMAAANEEDQADIFAAPPAPTSVLDALLQRLQKYKSTKETAESESNNAKARRLQRIINQYETAIKDYKTGRTVNFEDLPTPPGFGPIPAENEKLESNKEKAGPSKRTDESIPKNVNKPGALPTESNVSNQPVRKPKVQRTNTSTAEKQLEFLLERQKLFREAALSSKKNGDIQQAKEYLRMSKGFESMIEAVKCGLPIDCSSIPTPPQLESDFVIVNMSDCNENSDLSETELFETLENDLVSQIKACNKNKEYFLRLGDVSSASKFEKLGIESNKDLCCIKHLKATGNTIPKFHYETRMFSMVMCNFDLSDNDLQVVIERGIQLPGKADELDSFVKIEIPLPNSENPQRAKTHTIRDTNNPLFQEKFSFEFNRKSRSQLRIFKRHFIKLEVWSKGGFLRSDNLLGTCNIKLLDLESKCTIHDSFNLMDSRKKIVGGKIEAVIQIREPLLVKQVEEVKEKWLVIGN